MDFEEYKKLPKWKGKIFMQDEKTCFDDGYAACKAEFDEKLTKLAKDFEKYKGLMRELEIKCEEMEGLLNTAACNAANTENNYLNLQQRNRELKEILKILLDVCKAELSPFSFEAHKDVFKKAEHAI